MKLEEKRSGASTPERIHSLGNLSLILPHNEIAEQQVLGSILLEGDLIRQVSLSARDFYMEKHLAIFHLMHDMYKRDVPVDVLTVFEEIKRTGKEEITGGSSYLTYLTEVTSTTLRFDYYSQIVKEKAWQREAIKRMVQFIQATDNGVNNEQVQEAFNEVIRVEIEKDSGLKPVPAKDLPDVQQVNSLWGGIFYPGCIIQINSEPGVGKTTLQYNICSHGALEKTFLSVPFSKKIKSLYLDLETAKWLRRAKLERILGTKDLPENLHFLDTIDFERNFQDLLILCKRERYDFVIFDTQSRVLAVRDENDNAEANRRLNLMRRLTIETGCALILIHHTGKSESSKNVYRGRGASAIAGGVDIVVNLEALDEAIIKLTVGKNRIIGTNPVLYLKKVGEDLFDTHTPPGESSGFEIFKAQDFINSLSDARDWTTGEIYESGKDKTFSESTLKRALSRLVEAGKWERIKKGVYRKKGTGHGSKSSDYIGDPIDPLTHPNLEDYPEVLR